MQMAGVREGMNDPDRLQCPGKGQRKNARWSKLLLSSFPEAQIRLEVLELFTVASFTQSFKQKTPWAKTMDVRRSCPSKQGG